MGWLGPLVVVLAAIVAGLLLFYFLSGKKDSSTPHGAASVATQPSQSASSAAPSSSSSPQTTAALPDGSRECLVDTAGDTSSITAPNAVLTGTQMSCDFADRVISDVSARVQSQPTVANFTLDSEYSNFKGKSFSFTCDRQNHLTTCTAPGDHGQIALAVQDSAN